MKIDETFWVGLVAFSVATACVVAVIVIAVREKRRTGRLPREVVGGRGQCGWFFLVSWTWLFCMWGLRPESLPQKESLLLKPPLYVIVPGIDAALLIGYVALAVWAMTYAFRSEWHWRFGPWIMFQLLLPVLFSFPVYQDAKLYSSMPWVWIPAGLLAIALAPYCARFAYQEVRARGQAEPDSSPQPDFRLWRTGEPR